MSVEFIGMIGTQPASEIHLPRGAAIDVDYVRRFAQAHPVRRRSHRRRKLGLTWRRSLSRFWIGSL